MSGGAFSEPARAAILGRTGGRCAGCGRTDVTVQHRVARGMGGRHRASAYAIAHPANGLALCGHGTAGCHGWTEHHPTAALALGWRLPDGTDPIGVPYWTRSGVWMPWAACDDLGLAVHVYPDDALEVLGGLFDVGPADVALATAELARDRKLKL